MLFIQTAQGYYEQLCGIDVLGLKDTTIADQSRVHLEFLEQLHQSSEGLHQTELPWKEITLFYPPIGMVALNYWPPRCSTK